MLTFSLHSLLTVQTSNSATLSRGLLASSKSSAVAAANPGKGLAALVPNEDFDRPRPDILRTSVVNLMRSERFDPIANIRRKDLGAT